MKRSPLVCSLLTIAICICHSTTADDAKLTAKPVAPSPKLASRAEQQKSLAPFASLVGQWRGVGQPKRGSNRGAWTEKSEWIWDFSKKQVAIASTISKGKLAKTIRITAGEKKDQFVVAVTAPDKKRTTFNVVTVEEKKIVGESAADETGNIHRLTITKLNDKRTLLLLEKRKDKQSSYSRVAGVGYTRAGTSIAIGGSGEPVCVVTGGKGTIAVMHKGKTYYVCCSGCKSAFDDDPDGILADYRASLKSKKK